MRCAATRISCDRTTRSASCSTPSTTGGTAISSIPILSGARADRYYTDETDSNADALPVWDVRSGRFDGGWTVEIAIPFKTLRYKPGRAQVWGIQLRRAIRRHNEWAFLSPVPLAAARSGAQGIFRISLAGTLVGLEAPPARKNIDIKPYAISSVTTDRVSVPQLSNDFDANGGVDVATASPRTSPPTSPTAPTSPRSRSTNSR